MALSLLAEMLATWEISFLPLVGLESFLISQITASTRRSRPHVRTMGLAPTVRSFLASWTMDSANAVGAPSAAFAPSCRP